MNCHHPSCNYALPTVMLVYYHTMAVSFCTVHTSSPVDYIYNRFLVSPEPSDL